VKRSAVQNHDYNLAKESSTRLSHTLMIAGIALITQAISHAHGSSVIGVSVAEMRDVISGWSAKRTILGQAIFSHDSIGVGEDGPTHQPVEQLIALRAIPGLITLRPADATKPRKRGVW
jgi:transketolase